MFNRSKTPATPHTPAISLDKVPAGLVSLSKTAAVSLEKNGLSGLRAAVYLVVDRSYSMRRYFADGSVQHLADQALGLSAAVDDDGIVPLVMFDSRPYDTVDVGLDRYAGVVAHMHQLHGGENTMGGTHYTIAMRAVVDHYLASQATDPALVIFQTDGAPQDEEDVRLQLKVTSKLPIFWAFVGFGPSKVRFLTELDTMRGRLLDNASYFHAGADPRGIPDSALYDGITREFGQWVPQARRKGLLP
ncbi:VWA domain-containing protein [Streptomyces parvulus]|uniref:VWA domain-containing protein n=1 Tax=Streptomyces parvulus TaxID=146923 RepID=UPI001E374110|nr:VWA domain-containing protein [Streptomyces parvulus]MCC9154864.1 VWA domain-containing protein [Streptomyces parvulus]MCE7691291.1 VWA domain-containing protein [Streptomyces parvulus]